jgi:hypothetical protein
VFIPIVYLTTFQNRIAVLVQSLVAWFAGKKGVRLILHPQRDVARETPRDPVRIARGA